MSWQGCLAVLVCLATPTVAVGQDKFFDSNGVKIHYIEQGEGTPVVLVHGSGGSTQSWVNSGVSQKLAVDHHVIALDCRGHGMSGKPHETAEYGHEMSLDIVRLLDHLRISKAHIVGYSMGANLTALLLTLKPERFLTATLGGAAGRFDWTKRDDELTEQEAAEFAQYGFSPTLAREISPPGTPPLSQSQIDEMGRDPRSRNNDRLAMAALTRSRHDQAITLKELAAVKVPVLAISGSLDPSLSRIQVLAAARPDTKVVVIEGATHANAQPRPEFIAAIREFVRP